MIFRPMVFPSEEKVKNFNWTTIQYIKDKEKIEKLLQFAKANGIEILGVFEDAKDPATNICLKIVYKKEVRLDNG